MSKKDIEQQYVIRWFREQFGGRLCWWANKIPGAVYPLCLFCDCMKTDLHRTKEDRFTLLAAPLVVLFVGLPLAWYLLKYCWKALIWCCAVNEYVEEEEDSDDDVKKEN